MNTAVDRLLTLTVGDVMTRSVETLAASQPMAEAARLLAAKHVSGAPVVDEVGRCVGILSGIDFLRRARRDAADVHPGLSLDEHRLSEQAVGAAGDLASDYMSKAVQSVAPEASLVSAARIMCEAHIHHLPVLDRHDHVVGMLTSTDVIAALVNALDESVAHP